MHKKLPTIALATLTTLGAMCAMAPAVAQVAGTATAVVESTTIATGWSVKKTLMGKTIYNDADKKVGTVLLVARRAGRTRQVKAPGAAVEGPGHPVRKDAGGALLAGDHQLVLTRMVAHRDCDAGRGQLLGAGDREPRRHLDCRGGTIVLDGLDRRRGHRRRPRKQQPRLELLDREGGAAPERI